MIDFGVKAIINVVDISLLSIKFLDQMITKEVKIVATGADICGENGNTTH